MLNLLLFLILFFYDSLIRHVIANYKKKHKDNSDAFKESLILEGINYVIDLFDKSFKLIFLADRWFNSINIMKTIDDAGHIFCLRLKKNIKAFV